MKLEAKYIANYHYILHVKFYVITLPAFVLYGSNNIILSCLSYLCVVNVSVPYHIYIFVFNFEVATLAER